MPRQRTQEPLALHFSIWNATREEPHPLRLLPASHPRELTRLSWRINAIGDWTDVIVPWYDRALDGYYAAVLAVLDLYPDLSIDSRVITHHAVGIGYLHESCPSLYFNAATVVTKR